MYLDPGFGSMIIQLLIALIAACGAYFAIFKTKLRKLFIRNKKREDAEESKEE